MNDYIHVIVHKFAIPNYDDPESSIMEMIEEWSNTEKGKWVMDNSCDKINVKTFLNVDSFSKSACIVARMSEQNAIYYNLRWR